MNKTQRTFQCRDDLWTRVERLAERRGLTPDQVVEKALIQLFSRKKSTAASAGAGPDGSSVRAPSPKAPPPRRPAPVRPGPRPRPGGSRLPPPGRAQPVTRPLYLFCEGQWYAIDQDQFVIGRGSKYSDLAIKDANISRRHCAVVRRNGNYYIKDLGSTNGVEFQGERVDDHLVEEGSVYYLCDHELRFTFDRP